MKQHLAYAADASNAHGVDRHLFGLKKLLQPNEKVPDVFTDPAFGATSTWKLSTSQISSESFACWGFGEVTPEGYGVAYAIKEGSLTFTLTSLKLNTPRFKQCINEACLELQQLHERINSKGGAAAKPKL